MPTKLLAPLLLILAAPLVALDVGDTAPPLNGVSWAKGSEPSFGKQFTLVEFWATWCGPCIANIPHLTELNEEYGDQLAIAGLSNEDMEKVGPFVAEQGDRMAYNVGSAPAELYKSYMDGIPGIPHAFLVNSDGIVVWHGHPGTFDEIMQRAVAGTLNPEVIKLENSIQTNLQRRQVEPAVAQARKLLAIEPTNLLSLSLMGYVLQEEGDAEGYRALFSTIDQEAVSGHQASQLANLLLEQELAYRNLDLALAFAAQAKQKQGDSADALSIYARTRYLVGDLPGAIAAVQQALELEPDSDALSAELGYYQQAQELGHKQQ